MALQEEFEKQGLWLFRYRGGLPLIILGLGAVMYIHMKMNPETFFLENTPYEGWYELLCLLVGLAGLGVRIYTVGHTPVNTSGRNVAEQVADSLNTTGIYSLVRHPLYLGNFLMWLGPAMLTGNLWFVIAFCLFYWVYYERIMFAEEQFLRGKFGQAYLDWSKDVPPFLPSFKHFVAPTWPFSWKKVLKKEKNGLAALFIIFFAFNYAGNYVQGTNTFSYPLMIACVATGVMYLILKYLKKYTGVLNEENR